MRRFLPLILALWPSLAFGQGDDKDYLTALLEDSLSGAGREVVISGFQGALSSRAQMAEMSIADGDGIWITLSDVVLDWQRSDLLSGRITINTLSAREIDLRRLPNSGETLSAEAPDFALPELPVAINIGSISAEKLTLGAAILGEVVTARAGASLTLENGQGQGRLQILRLDNGAPEGLADVQVSFANASREMDIDVQISEGQGGILARTLGIPNEPSLNFSAKGQGPLNDFTADIALSSDGVRRFGGAVNLAGTAPAGGGNVTAFGVDLTGDLSVLMQPDYRPFFGTQTTLRATGATRAGGGFDLTQVQLATQSLHLAGSLGVGPSGLPERFDLTGVLQDPSGAAVILPLGLGSPASISKANITARFDQAKGEEWAATLLFEGWDQADFRASRGEMAAKGTLKTASDGNQVTANLSFNAEGLRPARAALGRAIGNVLWGDGQLSWTNATTRVKLADFRLGGEDYQINLNGNLNGLASGFAFAGRIDGGAQDLGRFADLLGQPIAGAGDFALTGRAVLLTGAFDGQLTANTRDLAFGIRSVDAMLKGQSTLAVDARRDAAGLNLRKAQLTAQGGDLDVSGRISESGSDITGRFAMKDMALSERGFGGSLSGTLAVTGTVQNALAVITAQSEGLDPNIAQLRKVLGAKTDITAEIAMANLVPRVNQFSLASTTINAGLRRAGVDGSYDISARLADFAQVAPQFPGAATLKGRANLRQGGADLMLEATGPAQLAVQVSGFVSTDMGGGARNNLQARGSADAALINAFIAPRSVSGTAQFDLALRGGLQLSAVSGTIGVQNGQLADPTLPFTLRNITATAQLAQGQARVTATSDVSTGGRIELGGTIGLSAPQDADLSIGLRSLGVRDPDLLETTISGDLRVSGPLRAGAKISGVVDLGRTEVQLRPTELSAPAALPNLRHQGDSRAVQITRSYAGRSGEEPAASGAAPFALDVTVRAANRVFVRGRGLDAELGGEVRLQGTTANVRPSGAFDLVQGRFEILTKRLTLEEVRLEMQGQLIPYLFVRGTNTRGNVITTVIIDGPAIDPAFRFSASPEMPEEEVLSQLLFDQNLTRLTPFQAVQLTGAIASLLGRGDGVVARARKILNLDDLDLQTTPDGATALKMGKYVSDNVYSAFTAESTQKQGLDFTYTLNQKIKLRAGAQTTGNTSVGIEFETNY